MSYQDLLGPLPESPIGHDFDLSRPVESFLATARGVALRPRDFFAALPRSANYLSPLVFSLICTEIAALLAGILGLSQGGGIAGLIGHLITGAIFAAIVLFVVAAIAQFLVSRIVGPINAGYAATFRVVAYSSVTDLVSWIPVIGTLISLYGVYLAIVGIREVHQTTTGKAALVVLIPAAVIIVIAAIGLAVAGINFL
jgi:hypothetical protein